MPPFVRISRDRRGYEHTYLFHVRPGGGRSARPRVIYWFRTPPGVRIGRPAFDAEMREAIESQFPDQVFDWETFEAIPPPPEVENWRERRRLEKAAKRARVAEASEPDEPEPGETESGPGAASDTGEAAESGRDAGESVVASQADASPGSEVAGPDSGRPGGRRSRRRGKGRGRDGAARPPVSDSAAGEVDPPTGDASAGESEPGPDSGS